MHNIEKSVTQKSGKLDRLKPIYLRLRFQVDRKQILDRLSDNPSPGGEPGSSPSRK
jgi:hypothetical protein